MNQRTLWFVVPGDLDTRTGGYGYDREIVAGLRDRGWEVTVAALGGAFPHPTEAALDDAGRLLARIPDRSLVMVDGLAFGVLPANVAREAQRLRFVALVHHPLALETGIDPAEAERLRVSERAALSSARGVIVTSRRTVAAVEDLGVPRDRIAVVEPGTATAPPAVGSTSGPVRLLCVASLVPRKGHDTLLDALTQLGDLAWRLSCVGGRDRDGSWARAMEQRCTVPPLAGRVEFAGELEGSALEAAYRNADLFVLPTRYEGYGMVIAEALARGLPVVSTPTGAIAELITVDAGVLVPADDSPTLARVLRSVISDRAALTRLKRGALQTRGRLASWQQASASMEAALLRLSPA
jgi:glycosyltransferase involved in cell wall biosynthesis